MTREQRAGGSAKKPSGRRTKPGIAQDPVAFVREVLREDPYDKQEEILRAMAAARRVSVVGCNGSGKDWAAARAVLWWMHSRTPVKAIVTGPTSRQVDDIVWNELRVAYGQASETLRGRMFRTSRYEIDEQSFALGFASNSPYNLQGFHSPNLLVVLTEAHAVHEQDMNAVRRLNPSRLLMTGNPFVNSGAFYDSHHSRRELYTTVQISAFDTPNLKAGGVAVPGMVTAQDIADRKEEWGEESALYIGSVLGNFPDNLDDAVVPLSAATEAATLELEPEGPLVVACDVARFGHDKTVVMSRRGPVARIAGWQHLHRQAEGRPIGVLGQHAASLRHAGPAHGPAGGQQHRSRGGRRYDVGRQRRRRPAGLHRQRGPAQALGRPLRRGRPAPALHEERRILVRPYATMASPDPDVSGSCSVRPASSRS